MCYGTNYVFCFQNNSQPPLKSVSGTTKPVKQQVIFKSNIEELASLATQLGLPAPSYSELKRKPTKKPVLYTAKVKVSFFHFYFFSN